MAIKPSLAATMAVVGLVAAAVIGSMPRVVLGQRAHSFQHFHGPVHGQDKEVAWVDKRGKQHHDFAAPAHYEFAYGVEDHHTGDYHGQKEHRDGKAVTGEYTIKEPTGNIRTVKYLADEDGFHATVHNSHGGSATYGAASEYDEDDD